MALIKPATKISFCHIKKKVLILKCPISSARCRKTLFAASFTVNSKKFQHESSCIWSHGRLPQLKEVLFEADDSLLVHPDSSTKKKNLSSSQRPGLPKTLYLLSRCFPMQSCLLFLRFRFQTFHILGHLHFTCLQNILSYQNYDNSFHSLMFSDHQAPGLLHGMHYTTETHKNPMKWMVTSPQK